MAEATTSLTESQAIELVVGAMRASGVSESNAVSVAKALVAAEIDGQKGHGFSRVASYCAQAASGKVDGKAEPNVERLAGAFVRIDAANGFAFNAIERAMDSVVADAATQGIAAAAITRSHHCGQLGAHVEQVAERGLVAIMVANTPSAMAPWGGTAPLFGTNPIAFAAPREGKPPLVIDLSLSRVARGKVMAAAQAGEPIPPGWALDENGQPTTDANAALSGSMIPAGDAKGAALAMMVEVLAATLTGANYSYEASSFFDANGEPPGVGQLLIGIQANVAVGDMFASRLEQLAGEINAQNGARLPGDSRLLRRAQAAESGIEISARLRRSIEEITE